MKDGDDLNPAYPSVNSLACAALISASLGSQSGSLC